MTAPSAMRVCSLASGSNGNCILVQAGDAAVLIDAGVSARAAIAGLHAAGLPETALRAILLTHEHSDHTKGLLPLSRRLGVPVVGNQATLARACDGKPELKPLVLNTGETMEIAGLSVRSFAVCHDASDPVGYLLEAGGKRVGYATDTGVVLPEILTHLGGVDLAIIEANHDVERLRNGPYPARLKRRILGVAGHLSNDTAAELALTLLRQRPTTAIWLAHLSAVNNTPQLAHDAVCTRLSAAGFAAEQVSVLPRGRPGPFWNPIPRAVQLTLF